MTFLDFLLNLSLFAGKAVLIVLAFSAVILLIAMLAAKSSMKPELEIKDLNQKYDQLKSILKSYLLNKDELKKESKEKKKKEKAEEKSKPASKPRIFVLNFKGDTKATQVEDLREEVSAVLSVATEKDEVLVKVESPGGVVYGYGLAASQLMRFREKKIPLVIAVDQIAASGGYMMACTANQILCAPFGIVGSIGVVAQVPNFNRALKKYDVDYKEYTAGEYKRTVSVLGEITAKGEEKFKEQLEETHALFKTFVHEFRPHMEISKVATGEYWFGKQAKELGLIDIIKTSDEYILEKLSTHQVVEVAHRQKKKLGDKLSQLMGKILTQSLTRLFTEIEYKNKF